MPDVPADALPRDDALREPIQIPVRVAEPLVPQPLPGEQLRVLDQQTPERHEGTVGGSLAGAERRSPTLERQITLPRTLDVDPLLLGGGDTVGAEAGDHTARARAAVARAEGVVERSLALAPPHQAVHVVGPQVVFGEPEPEAARVGIAVAGEPGRLAVQVDLRRLIEARHVAAEHVLEPADHLHPATVCRR